MRAKEAEQMKCLEFYEVWVDRVAAASQDGPDTPQCSTDSSISMPATARLEMQLQRLQQDLKPRQPAASGGTSTSSWQQGGSSSGAQMGMLQQDAAAGMTSDVAGASASTTSTAVDGEGGEGGEGVNLMARWYASITPEDLAYFKNMTPEGLAGELERGG